MLLLSVPFLISFRFLIVLAHWDGAYFHSPDDGFILYTDWMKQIRDGVLLSELALPGTHDSAAYNTGVDIVKTQAITFSEQLKYGIRFFDIRIGHSKDKFILCHGDWNLGLDFSDFLDAVSKFLREYPSEVVLFRLKEDQKPGRNTRSMEETLKMYLKTYKSEHLFETSPEYLTLGQARGKFLIISDNHEFHSYGVEHYYFQRHNSQKYWLNTNWELYGQWEEVREHIDRARNGDRLEFYTTYLTGSGGVFPYFVASGHSSPGTSAPRLATGITTAIFSNKYPDFPRVSCIKSFCTIAFEGLNTLTRDYLLKNRTRMRTAGVIMADFPGTDLILTIINENDLLLNKTINLG